jgi:hypothetical protein
MATFDEIGNGSVNVGEILKGMTINSLSTMARGLIIEMLSTNIHNFNLMNYDYMNIHMMRNAYEKVITLNTVGESAYTDGNGDAQATPAQYPSYTRGNNYMEFVNNTRQASNNGVLSTRVTNRDGNVRNLYIDDEYNRDAQVEFTGSYLDKNSILYKTKKLIRQIYPRRYAILRKVVRVLPIVVSVGLLALAAGLFYAAHNERTVAEQEAQAEQQMLERVNTALEQHHAAIRQAAEQSDDVLAKISAVSEETQKGFAIRDSLMNLYPDDEVRRSQIYTIWTNETTELVNNLLSNL